MLTVICKEIRNWFDKEKLFGVFEISGGTIDLSDTSILDGQYFRIVGSVFNDGVWQYPATELLDETFDGAIWLLAIPNDVIQLADDIAAWKEKYSGVDAAAASPFTSESFGGYSYSKGALSELDNASGAGAWRAVFAGDLNRWRKI